MLAWWIAVALPLSAQPIELTADLLVAGVDEAADVELSRFGSYVAVYDTTEGNLVRMYDRDLRELWRHRLSHYWAGSLDAGSVIQFAPDESYVLFPSARNTEDICVCDTLTGEPLAVLRGHEEDPTALGLSPDGRWLVSASYKELALWERDGAGFVQRQLISEFAPSIKSIEFLPDGRSVAISQTEQFMRGVSLYAVSEAGLQRTFHHEFEDRNISNDIYQIAISPTGDLIAAGYRDSILLFSLDDDQVHLSHQIRDIDLGTVYSLAFAPDGSALVSGHFRFVRWWLRDRSSWVEGTTTVTQQPVANDIEIAQDGTRVFVASNADENALAGFRATGLAGSSLGLLTHTIDGELSVAQRRVLSPTVVSTIFEQIGRAAFAERDMFETASEYEQRVAATRAQVRELVQEAVEQGYGARRAENTAARYDVVLRLTEQGSYDIDRQQYLIRFLDSDAWLHIDRDAARSLFTGWQAARVRVTRFDRADRTDYADFRLVHPENGREYPLVLGQNPFTGERLNAAGTFVPAIRVGQDLVIRELEIDGIFPTLHARYTRDAFGRFTLQNAGTGIVSDVAITIAVDGLTSGLTRVDVPTSLAAGRSVAVLLSAPISQQVLESATGGSTELRLEVSYRRGNRSHRQTIVRQMRVLNRNAIQWNDDRKIGAFMSTAHPSVLAWSAEVATASDAVTTPVLTRNLLYAMRLYESLRLAGIEYVIDPNTAFELVSQESRIVDFVRFPWETLAHGAGDCDDLSVLYATLLESVGVPTAFITTPGHIFMAFDTGIAVERVGELFSSSEALIVRDGRVWIPIETTILAEGFTRAWQVGALQWRGALEADNGGFFTTAAAWSEYAPVAIDPVAREATAHRIPGANGVGAALLTELDAFRGIELAPKLRRLSQSRQPSSPAVRNRIGVLYAIYGQLEQATEQFELALTAEAAYVPALINQANVLALRGEHSGAQGYLERARSIDPENARVLLGLALSYWENGDRDRARSTYEAAARQSPALARRFPLFADTGNAGSGRASAQADRTMLFGVDWADR